MYPPVWVNPPCFKRLTFFKMNCQALPQFRQNVHHLCGGSATFGMTNVWDECRGGIADVLDGGVRGLIE